MICCTASLHAQKKDPYKNVDNDVRLAALRRAQVWMPGDIASRNIKSGPRTESASIPKPRSRATTSKTKQTGTPKFDCAISPDDKMRVKYGEQNGEVYSEVAATRLLWALGFGADRMYPVKVICNGCPADPMKNSKKVDGTREFAGRDRRTQAARRRDRAEQGFGLGMGGAHVSSIRRAAARRWRSVMR